jgi:prevent-host-death family protein
LATSRIRELANKTKAVVEEVVRSGRPAVVTQRGRPVVAVVPIDQDALEDWVLAHAPEFVRDMREADEEVVRGEIGTPLEEILAELEAAGE